MIYKLIRWSRQVRIWLSGNKGRELRFRLFTLPVVIPSLEFRERLLSLGYDYNPFSMAYQGQIFTVRKAVPGGHQYHLRYYSDGMVTGHYEVDWLVDEKAHNQGKDLRALTSKEIASLRRALIGEQ
ncbi:hypothetical protein ES703_44497 [subsurface metagenome]